MTMGEGHGVTASPKYTPVYLGVTSHLGNQSEVPTVYNRVQAATLTPKTGVKMTVRLFMEDTKN